MPIQLRRLVAFAAASLAGGSLFAVTKVEAVEVDAETLAEIRALRAKVEELEPLRARLHDLERRVGLPSPRSARARPAPAAPAPQAEPAPVAAATRHAPPWPRPPSAASMPPGAQQPAYASQRAYGDKFLFKGISITPGGFISFDALYRDRYIGADLATPYHQIPFPNTPGSHLDEFRFTPRFSRFSVRTDADITPTMHIASLLELDLLGAAQTANNIKSSSYNPRLRHAYANLDLSDLGLHFLAGQTWTLLQTHNEGIRHDTLRVPPMIDANFFPGYAWGRQPGVRVVKDFGDKLAVAVSAEGSATTFALPAAPVVGTSALPLIGAPLNNAFPPGGALLNTDNSYSFNRMPDFIGKVAYDPTIMDRHFHIEGFGIVRDFTNRAYWGNHSVWGGGLGGSIVAPIIPNVLDVQVSGMIGRGIGRYGAGLISDATYDLTGAPQPVHERMLLVGVNWRPSPEWHLYAFAGGEFAGKQPKYANFAGVLGVGGYGNPLYNNSACNTENDFGLAVPALNLCSNQTKAIRQLTGGVWRTLYEGPYGRLAAGAQYSYTIRDGFVGYGGAPRGTMNTFMTSVRYFPF